MLRRNLAAKSKQFSEQFNARPVSIPETEVTVSITPRIEKRKIKKNKFAFSFSPQSFWEELRQSKPTVKQIRGPPRTKIPQSQIAQVLPEASVLVPLEQSQNKVELVDIAVERSPMARYLEQGQDLLALRPDKVLALQEIVKAKDATDVLIHIEDNANMMDALQVSAALHRVAKLVAKKGSSTHIQVIKSDSRFLDLLESTGTFFESPNQQNLGPVFLSNVFWALVKLDIIPETLWGEKLIDSLLSSAAGIGESMDLIGSNLYCIAELEKKKKSTNASFLRKIGEFQNILIDSASSQAANVTNVHQLVSVCTSLARLNRVEVPLLNALSDSLLKNISAIPMDDLTSALWVFTALKVTNSALFSKVQQALEAGKGQECSKRNLVDICWSLAKSRTSTSDESMTELFRFTLAPLIRNCLMDYSVRELCTILWSYASAEVVDFDFFNDVSHALAGKIDQMNAHDVSSTAWALGSVGYMHSEFFSSLKHQALMVKSQLSPLQLSRVIYGVCAGGVKDKHVLQELVGQAKNCMHALRMQNIMDILIGLQRVEFPLGWEPMLPFLKTIANNTDKISGRDAVQLIGILGELEGLKAGISHDLDIFDKLETIVSERFNCAGRWIPNGFDLVDLLKGLADLDSTNTELTERVILHLSTVYKSPSFTVDLFLKFLHAISRLADSNDGQKRLLSKLLLLKERGIQTAMNILTEQLLLACTSTVSLDEAVEIIDMYAKIGYADDHVVRFTQDTADLIIGAKIEPQNKVIFLRSLAQLQLLPDQAFALAEKLCNQVKDSDNIDVLMDYVWARLALADDPNLIPVEIFEKIADLYEQEDYVLPKNIFRAKQIGISCGEMKVSSQFDRFVKDLSIFGPFSKKPKSGGVQRLTKFIDKYESYICHSLAHSGIKHQQKAPALFYSVTASIGPSKVCLDLVGVTDTVTPEGVRWNGEKILRNIHLAQAGWRVKNIRIRDVQKALDCKSLHSYISDLVKIPS